MKDSNFNDFRKKLQYYRSINQLSQSQLSEKLNYSITGYRQIETGYRPVTLNFIKRLVTVTNIPITDWVNSVEHDLIYKTVHLSHINLTTELKYQLKKLNNVGKRRLALYIEANWEQLNNH